MSAKQTKGYPFSEKKLSAVWLTEGYSFLAFLYFFFSFFKLLILIFLNFLFEFNIKKENVMLLTVNFYA